MHMPRTDHTTAWYRTVFDTVSQAERDAHGAADIIFEYMRRHGAVQSIPALIAAVREDFEKKKRRQALIVRSRSIPDARLTGALKDKFTNKKEVEIDAALEEPGITVHDGDHLFDARLQTLLRGVARALIA